MLATYKLKASEINESFINTIKKMFKDREIEIVIHEVEDETEYLLKSQANRKHLLKAIANVDHGKNLKELSIEGL